MAEVALPMARGRVGWDLSSFQHKSQLSALFSFSFSLWNHWEFAPNNMPCNSWLICQPGQCKVQLGFKPFQPKFCGKNLSQTTQITTVCFVFILFSFWKHWEFTHNML